MRRRVSFLTTINPFSATASRGLRRGLRAAAVGLVVLPLALLTLVGVEVQLARNGRNLPDRPPLDLNGALGGSAGSPLQMVWMGDSTAAGVGATDADHALPTLVGAALHRPVEVISLAVSGARVADVVQDQVGGLAALDPDVVLVSVGGNDVVHLSSRANFRDRYAALVAAIPSGALLVVLGVPDMGAPPRYRQPLRGIAAFRGRQLGAIARSVADDNAAVFVDIAGETGPVMRSDTGRYFAADRYHPSDDGYDLWAVATMGPLRAALRERSL